MALEGGKGSEELGVSWYPFQRKVGDVGRRGLES